MAPRLQEPRLEARPAPQREELSPEARIEKLRLLERLLKEKLISEQEYQEKRARLLR
jgi:hypothetical protein